MFRNLLINLWIALLTTSAVIAAPSTTQQTAIQCSPALSGVVQAIQRVPEAQRLINDIQKAGSFSILSSEHSLAQQFGAFWDSYNREINLSVTPHITKGAIIGSILFEMQNALVSKQLDDLHTQAERGVISCDEYVKGIEYIEYCNSHAAAKIAERGIALGLFPADARLPTYRNFDEHFYYQKIGGHSTWLARNYQRLRA